MSLREYNKKRNFTKTPEPQEGGKSKTKRKPTFVVQKHDARSKHHDFRLEIGGVLKSWAIPKGLSNNPKEKRLAVQTEDHPLSYKDFKGVIPKGNYGAGFVEIWDKGTYKNSKDNNLLEDFKNGDLTINLSGSKLTGEYHLQRMKGQNWLLVKKEVPLPESNEAKVPDFIKPMFATLANEPFDNESYIFEAKLDGYRAIAHTGETVELYSRNFKSFKKKYQTITDTLAKFPFSVVFDGEIVVLDSKGVPSFQMLQNYSGNKNERLTFYVFDLLFFKGLDLRQLPWKERRKTLEKIFPKLKNMKLTKYVKSSGIKFFEENSKRGFEGVIAKNADSQYQSGVRTSDWLKIKSVKRQEFVIGGFTIPMGTRKHFGALLLGVYDNGKLTYVGHTGSGFNDINLSQIYEKLIKLKTETSPFSTNFISNTTATFVKPKLVAEVKFEEWTKDGSIRFPIFLGMRTDKSPKSIKREVANVSLETNLENTKGKGRSETNGKNLKVSNLEKIYFPEKKLTKGDVIKYYKDIQDIILPHLDNRLQVMNRHPGGIYGESFYQKNIESPPNFLKTQSLTTDSGTTTSYLVLEKYQDLLYMNNLGCIELNPFNTLSNNLNIPTWTIFDLDPIEVSFKEVVKVALSFKRLCDKIEIPSFCKTSGKKGLHVYIPMGGKYNIDQTKTFAKILRNIVVSLEPLATANIRKEDRKSKIFIDIARNDYEQTASSVYSLRPVKEATISTPILWEEVNEKLDPKEFNIETIRKRLEKVGDLFKGVLKESIDLDNVASKLSKYSS